MRVLVTGGAGFIGSHLIEALVKGGHRVRVLDNLSTGTFRNLEKVSSRIKFIRGDIRNTRTLQRALRGVEVVFHQAALRSVPKSVGDPDQYHAVNTTATLQLLQLAHREGLRRVVYASSSSVYGQTPLPQREKMIPVPKSPYAVSKLAAEHYCTMFSRLYGLPTVCLRYFNVYGPRQPLDSEYAAAVPRFITCLLKGESPPIHGDGFQSRDFTFVEDVVQANLKAALAPEAVGRIFNIASGSRHSVRQLAKVLGEILQVKIPARHTPPRPGDIPHTWANISLAKRLLGYRVSVSFEEGLSRTAYWFREHPEAWETR